MKITVKVILEEEGIETLDESIFSLEKKIEQGYEAGLTLEEWPSVRERATSRHLKECEFRFNNRGQKNLLQILWKIWKN